MSYDPKKHHRRSIRLRKYDYSSVGMYYVTLRVLSRQCSLGELINNSMKRSALGTIAEDIWTKVPEKFENVELDQYVIMPNHLHGIIVVTSSHGTVPEKPSQGSTQREVLVRASHESPLRDVPSLKSPLTERMLERRKMLPPKIIGWYKMNSAKRINEMRGTKGSPF